MVAVEAREGVGTAVTPFKLFFALNTIIFRICK